MNKKETASKILQEAKINADIVKAKQLEMVMENLAPQVKSLIDAKLEEAESTYEDQDENLDETIDLNAFLQEAEMEDGESEDDESGEGQEGEDDESGEGQEGDDMQMGGDDKKISDMTKDEFSEFFKQIVQSELGDEAPTQDQTELTPDMTGDGELDEDSDLLEVVLNEIKRKDSEDSEKEKLMKENKALREAVEIYKQTLNESRLGQAHVTCLNKLIMEGKVDKTNVLKISKQFDEMTSVEEIERAYGILSESLSNKKIVQPKRPVTQITESLKNSNPAPTQKTVLKEGVGDSDAPLDFKERILKNLR